MARSTRIFAKKPSVLPIKSANSAKVKRRSMGRPTAQRCSFMLEQSSYFIVQATYMLRQAVMNLIFCPRRARGFRARNGRFTSFRSVSICETPRLTECKGESPVRISKEQLHLAREVSRAFGCGPPARNANLLINLLGSLTDPRCGQLCSATRLHKRRDKSEDVTCRASGD